MRWRPNASKKALSRGRSKPWTYEDARRTVSFTRRSTIRPGIECGWGRRGGWLSSRPPRPLLSAFGREGHLFCTPRRPIVWCRLRIRPSSMDDSHVRVEWGNHCHASTAVMTFDSLMRLFTRGMSEPVLLRRGKNAQPGRPGDVAPYHAIVEYSSAQGCGMSCSTARRMQCKGPTPDCPGS